MSLIHVITDIRTRIAACHYANEGALKPGIVVRILGTIGWPVDDTSVVWPIGGSEQTWC
jgi:predicted type IV restriction endonuclease